MINNVGKLILSNFKVTKQKHTHKKTANNKIIGFRLQRHRTTKIESQCAVIYKQTNKNIEENDLIICPLPLKFKLEMHVLNSLGCDSPFIHLKAHYLSILKRLNRNRKNESRIWIFCIHIQNVCSNDMCGETLLFRISRVCVCVCDGGVPLTRRFEIQILSRSH